MALTYEKISSSTVGSGGVSSITFNSIPQTYTDLKIVFSCRTDNASIGQSIGVLFNGTSSGNSWVAFWGNGTSSPSSYGSSQSDLYVGESTGAQASSSIFGSGEVYIPNYTGSWYKTLTSISASEHNGTNGNTFFTSALSGVGGAITSLTIRGYGGSQTIQQHSSFYLYGIKKS